MKGKLDGKESATRDVAAIIVLELVSTFVDDLALGRSHSQPS